MTFRLADNEWGFSVAENNPFRIFRILQDIAKKSVGEAQVIDLSRGDPGYGFTPGVRARRFMGYLLYLDTVFNNTERRVVTHCKTENWEDLRAEIKELTMKEYGDSVGEQYLNDLDFYLSQVAMMANEQGLDWTEFDVFFETFKYCNVSGGTYHDPLGETLVRVVVAWWHQKTIDVKVDYQDLIFTAGASHAIGTLFKLLGAEGLGFLGEHDRVMVTSPVYAPYNSIMESRCIDVLALEIDPLTGEIADHSRKEMDEYEHDVKVVVLVDPNNPTGFSLAPETLEAIGAFAKRKNALIITDEVYSSFFETKKTMIDVCPERTIRINARSKIERSTGLRFGDVMVTKEGQQYIMENILHDYVNENTTWNELFRCAKAPGGILGEFQHTTFVPGPAQFLGALHVVLGKEERGEYRIAVGNNMNVFTETLELPHRGNMYYIIFDLNKVEGANKQQVPMEEKMVQLAKRGVIFVPANLFFSKADRMVKDHRNTVRASVVNTTPENIKKAAEIVKEYLCGNAPLKGEGLTQKKTIDLGVEA
ncbi:MAG: pyridoxal phosphate-dependent aminotransferase [Candidatus Peregrinibacteria bacterium]|nr:pyridoxal phosphate-dependent aminotransferase [Candidatus Peregrinibacteria bacterium]